MGIFPRHWQQDLSCHLWLHTEKHTDVHTHAASQCSCSCSWSGFKELVFLVFKSETICISSTQECKKYMHECTNNKCQHSVIKAEIKIFATVITPVAQAFKQTAKLYGWALSFPSFPYLSICCVCACVSLVPLGHGGQSRLHLSNHLRPDTSSHNNLLLIISSNTPEARVKSHQFLTPTLQRISEMQR